MSHEFMQGRSLIVGECRYKFISICHGYVKIMWLAYKQLYFNARFNLRIHLIGNPTKDLFLLESQY
jgi:hypothetical protein